MGAPVAGTGSPERSIGHCSCPGLFNLLRGISGGWCVGAIAVMHGFNDSGWWMTYLVLTWCLFWD